MIYAIEKLNNELVKGIKLLIEKQQIELWNSLNEEINLDWDAYHDMEDAGVIYIFTARDKDQLIGYCSFIVTNDPHYLGKLVALQDSIFVLKEYRNKGAGEGLIDYCDDILENKFKVKSIQHSVNVKVDFSPLLERKGYVFTEKMMVRRFK